VIVITCYFRPLEGTPAPGEVRLVHITPNFVSTFPVQVFAYTCAQNVGTLHHIRFAYVEFRRLIAVYLSETALPHLQ